MSNELDIQNVLVLYVQISHANHGRNSSLEGYENVWGDKIIPIVILRIFMFMTYNLEILYESSF